MHEPAPWGATSGDDASNRRAALELPPPLCKLVAGGVVADGRSGGCRLEHFGGRRHGRWEMARRALAAAAGTQAVGRFSCEGAARAGAQLTHGSRGGRRQRAAARGWTPPCHEPLESVSSAPIAKVGWGFSIESVSTEHVGNEPVNSLHGGRGVIFSSWLKVKSEN